MSFIRYLRRFKKRRCLWVAVAAADVRVVHLDLVLGGLGLQMDDVVKTTIFLAEIGHFQMVNEVYAEALGECRPARATVAVAALPKGALVEIEAVAARAS